MSINVIFNNKKYSLDKSKLQPITELLINHLVNEMAGTGTNIVIGGVAYSVDNGKLTTARADFVNHLGIIEGNDRNVVVAKNIYGIDENQLTNAKADLHAVLSSLSGRGELTPSEGLEFRLNDDGNSYSVADIGTCTDSTVVIPAEYNGLPVTVISSGAFDAPGGGENEHIVNVIIPDTITRIDGSAFLDCVSLETILIPDSVTSIGRDAFRWGSASRVYYGGDFESWSAIEFNNMYANPLNTGGILYLTNSSGEYEPLTEFYISENQTDIDIEVLCFYDSLINIKVDKNNPNYKDIDGNLYTKDGKTLLRYAVGKENFSFVIPDGVVTIGSRAFKHSFNLGEVIIPNGVTEIGEYAFLSSGIINMIVPDSVKRIDYNAFQDCKNLTTFYTGNGVTTIESYTFDGDHNLSTLVIGTGVKSIGEYMGSCNNLSMLCIPANVNYITPGAFDDCENLINIYIDKPENSLEEAPWGANNATVHWNSTGPEN